MTRSLRLLIKGEWGAMDNMERIEIEPLTNGNIQLSVVSFETQAIVTWELTPAKATELAMSMRQAVAAAKVRRDANI